MDTVEALLTRLDASYEAEDFAAYSALVDRPFVVFTNEVTHIRTTEAELRSGFDRIVSFRRRERIVRVERQLIDRRGLGTTMIVFTQAIRYHRQDGTVFDRFVSSGILRLCPDGWRFSSVVNPFNGLYDPQGETVTDLPKPPAPDRTEV